MNFKEPSLQIVLWSLHCFVLFSFVFYMNYHLYFIWIVIHCSYTEAIMFLIFGLLLLKWILCISCILCVLKLCVYTGQHGRTASGWMFLPCINILEKKKKKKITSIRSQWHNSRWLQRQLNKRSHFDWTSAILSIVFYGKKITLFEYRI